MEAVESFEYSSFQVSALVKEAASFVSNLDLIPNTLLNTHLWQNTEHRAGAGKPYIVHSLLTNHIKKLTEA